MALKKPQYSGFVATPATATAAGRAYVPPTYTHPAFVCGSTRTVDGRDWNVTLFSDDTVRISVDGSAVATGHVDTEGTFRGYMTRGAAITAARQCIKVASAAWNLANGKAV